VHLSLFRYHLLSYETSSHVLSRSVEAWSTNKIVNRAIFICKLCNLVHRRQFCKLEQRWSTRTAPQTRRLDVFCDLARWWIIFTASATVAQPRPSPFGAQTSPIDFAIKIDMCAPLGTTILTAPAMSLCCAPVFSPSVHNFPCTHRWPRRHRGGRRQVGCVEPLSVSGEQCS
jgi:hypothetical protein